MIVDAAKVFRTLTNSNHMVKQEVALKRLGIDVAEENLHNAANDAWYALLVIFAKGEEAELQANGSIETKVDWRCATSLPRTSPDFQRNVSKADREKWLGMPTLPRGFVGAPSPPPHGGPDAPSSTLDSRLEPPSPTPIPKRRRLVDEGARQRHNKKRRNHLDKELDDYFK